MIKNTRNEQTTTLAEALLSGLAPGGGLFLPVTIPDMLADWRRHETLPDLAAAILDPWLHGEIPSESLRRIVAEALDFPIPLVALSKPWEKIRVLELFHGPTLSFKDVGARVMARLLHFFLQQRGERRIVLVATSGDTGSAVADGFAGLPGLAVVLLYPKGRVSDVQERQLVTPRPNVFPFAVEGVFDDCQRLVKAALVQARTLPLSTANSINLGRLLPQMVYYFWAARKIAGATPTFCVPSGNLGNLTAGMLALQSGMPARRFIAAHNANTYFVDYLAYGPQPPRATRSTLSNAMDVGLPSNFERLAALFSHEELRTRLRGYSISDDETLATMRRAWTDAGYLADPHTAVGLAAAHRFLDENNDAPVVVLATAHPAKFPDIVARATGEFPRHFALESLPPPTAPVPTLAPDVDDFLLTLHAIDAQFRGSGF